MHQIARVLALFRAKGWPVLYPYVSQKETFDKRPARRQGAGADDGCQAWLRLCRRSGPRAKRCASTEKHPSAFFGTPLASYLIERGIDTLVVTGCTTSGCVRGTVVDGFAYNFRVARAARVPSTTAVRCRMRSTCSTCRKNTRTW